MFSCLTKLPTSLGLLPLPCPELAPATLRSLPASLPCAATVSPRDQPLLSRPTNHITVLGPRMRACMGAEEALGCSLRDVFQHALLLGEESWEIWVWCSLGTFLRIPIPPATTATNTRKEGLAFSAWPVGNAVAMQRKRTPAAGGGRPCRGPEGGGSCLMPVPCLSCSASVSPFA